MFARLALSSETPSLVLEEVENILTDVSCQEQAIELKIIPDVFPRMCKLVDSAPSLLLITSHHGCNQQGGRLPYRYTYSACGTLHG